MARAMRANSGTVPGMISVVAFMGPSILTGTAMATRIVLSCVWQTSGNHGPAHLLYCRRNRAVRENRWPRRRGRCPRPLAAPARARRAHLRAIARAHGTAWRGAAPGAGTAGVDRAGRQSAIPVWRAD